MKMSLATTFVFGVALLGASSSARADELGRVTVPFSFTVNGHTLPAGQYDVRTDDQATSVVMLDNVANPKTGTMFSTIPDYRRGPEHEKLMLTFAPHGSEHQLSTVWQPGQPGRDVVNR